MKNDFIEQNLIMLQQKIAVVPLKNIWTLKITHFKS